VELEIPDMEAVKDVAINRARKKALEAIMQLRKKNTLKRFRSKGIWREIKSEKRRTKEYEKRKGQVRAGTKGQPHRFFGDAEKRFRAGPVVSKSKQAFHHVTNLNKGYSRRAKPNYPNLQKEIMEMTPKEEKLYAEIYQKTLVETINNDPKARKKRKIKS
jgi:hypothetical protein